MRQLVAELGSLRLRRCRRVARRRRRLGGARARLALDDERLQFHLGVPQAGSRAVALLFHLAQRVPRLAFFRRERRSLHDRRRLGVGERRARRLRLEPRRLDERERARLGGARRRLSLRSRSFRGGRARLRRSQLGARRLQLRRARVAHLTDARGDFQNLTHLRELGVARGGGGGFGFGKAALAFR